MISLRQTTKPTAHPVNLATAKEHLRLPSNYTAEDNMLNAYIAAAVKIAEDRTNRQLMEATYTAKLDRFPAAIVINKTPLISVTSIKYIDTDGTEQTLSASNYLVDTYSEPFRITPAFGLSFPSTRKQNAAVTIVFKAGYASAADVPANIISGILILIDNFYKNRGDVVIGRLVSSIPLTAERLFESERVAIM